MDKKNLTQQCNLTKEEKEKLQSQYRIVEEETYLPEKSDTLTIKIDWWLWRVIAMTGAITEVAKHRPVNVATSRPLAFWGNKYIKCVYWLDDRNLYRDAIHGNDYKEIEPYTDPDFFNKGMNWLDVAAKQLWLDKACDPIMWLAEHEQHNNLLEWNAPILFQAFGSSMNANGADKSYRSFRVQDAQYIADELAKAWYTVYIPERDNQPKIKWSRQLTTQDLRWLVSLADRYPVVWCDSSLQHAAKAFGKKSVIMWSGTDAWRFGYESHINMRNNASYTYVPFRLWVDFNLDIINQYTNLYTKDELDNFIQTVIKTYPIKK